MAGYIGSRASVVSSGAERKKTFDITTTTTVLTGLSYTPTFVHLFHNGVRLVDGTDYTATDSTSITLTTAAENGDQVVVVSYATFQAADAYTKSETYTKAEADAGFVSDPNGAVTVDGSGNVGIGTAAPSAKMGINAAAPDFTFLQSDAVKYRMGVSNVTNGGVTGSASGDYFARTSGGKMMFSTNDGVTAHATIDSSGNVGINTALPTNLLHLAGNGATPLLRFSSASYPTFYWDIGRENLTTGDFLFNRANGGASENLMRITSSGNVLVGTAVAGQPDENAAAILPVDGSFRSHHATGTASGTIHAYFTYGGLGIGTITQNGTTGVSYNTSSDYRLKENITPVQNAGDIVKAMQPVTYTFKSDGSWHDGFLAHELQELHPRAVVGEKDAMKDEEYEVTPAVEATYDDEGVELTPAVPAVMGTRSVPDYQGVDYSKLTPILTAALQEALNKIDALEARLTALEVTP